MITNDSNVARALFSPKMVVDGEIQPEAFKLRASIKEDFISVAQMSISSWLDDIKSIPQYKNRHLCGYAKMNVGAIRGIQLRGVAYDVRDCSNKSKPSHAGIFISINGENLIGGKRLECIANGMEQDFLLLAIQRELVDIAQKGLVTT